MTLFIIVIGIFVALIGVLLTVRPAPVFDFIEQHGDRPWVYVTAVGVRALLGLALINQAGYSKFPHAIEIFGWLVLAAALFLLALGPRRFTAFLHKVADVFKPFARAVGWIAIPVGGLLVYAFI